MYYALNSISVTKFNQFLFSLTHLHEHLLVFLILIHDLHFLTESKALSSLMCPLHILILQLPLLRRQKVFMGSFSLKLLNGFLRSLQFSHHLMRSFSPSVVIASLPSRQHFILLFYLSKPRFFGFGHLLNFLLKSFIFLLFFLFIVSICVYIHFNFSFNHILMCDVRMQVLSRELVYFFRWKFVSILCYWLHVIFVTLHFANYCLVEMFILILFELSCSFSFLLDYI